MPRHEYTPSDALEILIQRVDKRDPALANRMRQIIDAGTVDAASEPTPSGKKTRSFRQSRRFTDEEALEVATGVLRACFVELPACIEAAMSDLTKAVPGADSPIGSEDNALHRGQVQTGPPFVIAIEVVRQTTKFPSTKEFVELPAVNDRQLEEQKQNLSALKSLLDFE